MMSEPKHFDDAVVGVSCISPQYEVIYARVRVYAELSGDFTPVYADEAYAKTTPFGTRVAHGLFGLSIKDGLTTRNSLCFRAGMLLGWVWNFVAPLKLGDVLLPAELIKQRDEAVQRAEHCLMIPMRSSNTQKYY
jgi:acyl dehydratase